MGEITGLGKARKHWRKATLRWFLPELGTRIEPLGMLVRALMVVAVSLMCTPAMSHSIALRWAHIWHSFDLRYIIPHPALTCCDPGRKLENLTNMNPIDLMSSGLIHGRSQELVSHGSSEYTLRKPIPNPSPEPLAFRRSELGLTAAVQVLCCALLHKFCRYRAGVKEGI